MSVEPPTDPQLDPADRELGERLGRDRPVPAAGFRGMLARRLAERDPGYGPRPPWLVPVVSASVGGGLVLILISALAATGAL